LGKAIDSEAIHRRQFCHDQADEEDTPVEIVGRAAEKAALQYCLESKKPEFLAVYGRRRVGKTFLIREYFGENIVFAFTGSAKQDKTLQLANFAEAAQEYGLKTEGPINDWREAFRIVKQAIRDSKKEKKVVFIDELPWLATHKSDFIPALEYFWNSFGAARQDLLLVVCGSATSWIIDHVIHEHGGLYGRVTKQLFVEAFFASRGIVLNRYQIAELYMILGGIPYYLDYIEKGISPARNIDKMFFAKRPPLEREFQDLYASLFRKPEKHLLIVEALGENTAGLTRDEIVARTAILSGGQLTKTLRELEQCGFIEATWNFAWKKKEEYYKLIDFYTLFYLKHIRGNRSGDAHFWQNKNRKGEQLAWYGLAFERLCKAHVSQIKQKLGIAGVSTRVSTWRSRHGDPAVQIDLVIDREDNIVNLCEMKFSVKTYSIEKDYDMKLRMRAETFREETGTKKALHTTMVTTHGISRNAYYGEVQAEVTLDDLFVPAVE
jgi:AAA+ ATPase superfamily predicted ATPase